MTPYLLVYVLGAGLTSMVALIYSLIDMSEEEIPKRVAATMLWPISLAILVVVGLRMWMPQPKKGELSRKQQRALNYERERLAIMKAQHDETERAMRIING